MADIAALYSALERADQAGDVASAKALAEYIKGETTPQTSVLGYAKEAVKAIPRGAMGFLDSAVTGAAALLPEEYEKPVVAKVHEWAQKFSPQAAPGYEDAIPTKLGEGVGSLLGGIAVPGGLAGRALAFGASGAGEARQRAQAEGATPEEISSATAKGILPGLTDIIPTERLLGRFGRPVIKGATDRIASAAVTGGLEGAQEVAQSIAQNFIAQGYKPEQDLYEGAAESGGYGFGVGALAQTLMDLALPGRSRAAKPQKEIPPEAAAAPEAPAPAEQVGADEVAASAAGPTLKKTVVRAKNKDPQTVEAVEADLVRLKAEVPNGRKHAKNIANKIKRLEALLATAPVDVAAKPLVPSKAPPKQLGWDAFLKTNPDEAGLQARLAEVEARIAWEKAQPKPVRFRIDALEKQRDVKIPAALKELGGNVVASEPIKLPGQKLKPKTVPFVATHEWQEVPTDAVLPPGLEIQMNQSTGKNYARLKEAPNVPIAPELAQDDDAAGAGDEGRRDGAGKLIPSAETDKPVATEVVADRVGSLERPAGGAVNGEVAESGALTEPVVKKPKRAIKGFGAKKAAPEVAPEVAPAEGTPDPERLRRAAEYQQVKGNSPEAKAARAYIQFHGGMDEAIKAVGFDVAEGVKEGAMFPSPTSKAAKAVLEQGVDTGKSSVPYLYPGGHKVGGKHAKTFSKWVEVNGTSRQKNMLGAVLSEYAKRKAASEAERAKAAEEKSEQRLIARRKLEQATKEQLAEDQREEFKQRERDAIGDTETEAEAANADKATVEAEAIRAERAAAKAARAEKTAAQAKDIVDLRSRKEQNKILDEAASEEGDEADRYSQGEPAAPTGHTKEDVRKTLKRQFFDDKRFDDLVTVVQTEADLLEEIRNAEGYKKGTRGVTHKGRVWLVADNIRQGKELGVFLHEAGAHIGLDKLIKPTDREFLAGQVRKWAEGKDDRVEVQAAKEAVRKGGKGESWG
jgi:hypothetical protein